MTILSTTEAGTRLSELIEETSSSHQPILITGEQSNGVLLSQEDWNAIAETLHLESIPGMRESIVEGMGKDPSECSSELDW